MLKVITDERIKDCAQCPLKPTYTHDCGKLVSRRGTSGSAAIGKKPNENCKLEVR